MMIYNIVAYHNKVPVFKLLKDDNNLQNLYIHWARGSWSLQGICFVLVQYTMIELSLFFKEAYLGDSN